MNDIPKFIKEITSYIPKTSITYPARDTDCPAAPICEWIGNLRKGCSSGGIHHNNVSVCIPSLILLLSRIAGLWTPEMEEEIENRRKIGFHFSSPQESQEE